jgi:hypothetical protein
MMVSIEQTSWNAEEYSRALSPGCTGQNKEVESQLMEQFPPIYMPAKMSIHPMVVTDCDGRALVWYLPGLLTVKRKVRI